MKKVTLAIAMAALVIFAGCKKDKEITGTTLKASIEQYKSGDSKTSIDPSNGAIKWTTGDKIVVSTGTTTGTFTLTSGAGSTTGTFNGEYTLGDNNIAVYPETASIEGNTVTVTLPAEPAYAAERNGSTPMLSTFTDPNDLHFTSLCGALGISLKAASEDVAITTIEVVSKTTDEKLNGTFTVDATATGNDLKLVKSGTDGTNSVRFNCNATLTTTPQNFYFAMPVGTLASGFTLNVYGTGADPIFSTDTDNNITIVLNQVNQMPVLEVALGNMVDLSALPGDYEAQDGDILTGTISGNHKISIANNATVTLSDVDITSLTDGAEYAGITCSGNANIILEGTNNIVGGVFLRVESDPDPWIQNEESYHIGRYPGIYIPSGYTLTIDGTGTLNASPAYANASKADHYDCYAAGIGGGYKQDCGNIVINGGTIVARGGGRYGSAGIGGATSASCGDITITGGTVTAIGGGGAAGIGSGSGAWANTGSISSSCGDILISGGTVTATGGNDYWGAGAGIGSGEGYGSDRISTCGVITITSTVTQVTANRGIASDPSLNNAQSIGAGGGNFSTCGTVTIENGANVIQN